MRLPLRIAEDLREVWPEGRPLFVRVSATDHIQGGWCLTDTLVFAAELKRIGVDVVDCSSGGFDDATGNAFSEYHVPYAEQVARQTGISTMAAGLIVDAKQAEAITTRHRVDLVGLAREALVNPNWPLHALLKLEGAAHSISRWPQQDAWALYDRLKGTRP
jgi:2,4-dienoyl-CoA reductase-like NADH-dependent reductase (Old Yellow Enzyme family)